MTSLSKAIFYAFLFLINTWDFLYCKKLGRNFISFTDDEVIATITSDNEIEFMNAIEKLNNKGGLIYIDTPVISLKENNIVLISGNLPGGIIGKRQENGEYPIFDFTKRKEQILFSGIFINGDNKYIEYIIIENTPGDGVIIDGDSNILDHVISRYNFGSGFAIYGNFNKLNYCYAYRNNDLGASYSTSDGFYIFGEINNIFNYCFAWDNANSGFNYEKYYNTSELSFLHSGSWNNGNINVFTGKYDYDNGSPLDKKMWTIQDIMESDPNFISNYYNKKYNIDDAILDGLSAKEWIAKFEPKLVGNGFIFGYGNSSQNIEVKRNVLYCVSFEHKNGGFIDNYNHKYNAYVTNCVSFNNNINYRLPYTFSKWTDNWSWGSKNKDQLNKVSAKQPSNTNTAQRAIYNVRDQIVKAVSANMFPDSINFDNTITRLK